MESPTLDNPNSKEAKRRSGQRSETKKEAQASVSTTAKEVGVSYAAGRASASTTAKEASAGNAAAQTSAITTA